MPRVHYVKKARKDNSAVKKGEPYYWWKFRYAGKRCSRTRPRPSQLTQSDKLARYYEAQEAIEDTDAHGDIQELIDTLNEQAEDIRVIGEEYQESADNIREHFESSEVADDCEEKSYMCEATADNIQGTVSSLEDIELGPDDIDAVSDIIADISWEM